MLGKVLKTPMNPVAKHSLIDHWWALGRKHQNKGVHRYEKGFVSSAYSCICFIQSFFCFIFQAGRQFFFIWTIIHFIGTVTVKNKCWLCRFSKYAEQNFSFTGNAFSVSRYLVTVIIRGVCRTQSRICKLAFCKKG